MIDTFLCVFVPHSVEHQYKNILHVCVIYVIGIKHSRSFFLSEFSSLNSSIILGFFHSLDFDYCFFTRDSRMLRVS